MLAKSINGDAHYELVYIEEREYEDITYLQMITTDIKTDLVVDGSFYPSATSEAMATYQNINENIYLGSANGKLIAEESMPCECKFEPGIDDLSAACGDDDTCINRMMFMECMVQDCPCDRYCRNCRFQLKQYARVDVIKTEKKGFGLRALTDLPRNAFIMEYIGEVITNTEFIRRTRAYEMEGLQHYYFMTLKTDEIIDATKKGCLARFINHSCNPNSVTQKWVVGKTMRIGIFTKKPVKAGTELTFDYKFERYGAIAQKCYCGELNCKGYIGGATKVDEEEEEEEEPSTPVDQVLVDEIKDAVTLTQKRMLGKIHKRRESEPLHEPDEVQKFVKKMLDSVGKKKFVNKLLRRLELTNANTAIGRECLKKFVRLHGLKMLKFWLGEWKNDEEIVEKVLGVLEQLPLANRNGLEDCQMFDIVDKFTAHQNENISILSRSLLENWQDLKSVYRIPKRAYVEPKESTSNKRREHPTDDEDSSLLPTLKRSSYFSTREYIDPDDDYYEYLTYNADFEEIQFKMNFLPSDNIPTAPRAMLESSLYGYGSYRMNCDSNYATGIDESEGVDNVYSEDIPTGPSGYSYYEMYGYSEIYPPSTSSLYYDTDNTNTNNNSTTATIPVANSTNIDSETTESIEASIQQQQQINNSGGSTPSSTSNPKLPTNWRMATTEDGSIYYYHKITNKTQWTFPEEKISSIEGVDPTKLEDIVQQAIIRNSHSPSVDDSPTSTNIHKQLQPLNISPSSSSLVNINNLNNNSSDNNFTDDNNNNNNNNKGNMSKSHGNNTSKNPDGLDEAELKKEVGKIVTKYLSSSKNKPLWQGDKHLFKELARKLTHHIVEREVQSNRKVISINSSVRTKIEKLIDSHGDSFVTKIKSKKERP
ncbi:unnamed protein product [Cunninghamella echinulata]